MNRLSTATSFGDVVVLNKLVSLTDPRWGTNGSINLAILLNEKGQPDSYVLIWQWGGDWDGFLDGAENDPDRLDGWEPSAVEEAVEEAIRLFPDNIQIHEDLEWFSDWVCAARKTLEQ